MKPTISNLKKYPSLWLWNPNNKNLWPDLYIIEIKLGIPVLNVWSHITQDYQTAIVEDFDLKVVKSFYIFLGWL